MVRHDGKGIYTRLSMPWLLISVFGGAMMTVAAATLIVLGM
jgi:hypothetical protein